MGEEGGACYMHSSRIAWNEYNSLPLLRKSLFTAIMIVAVISITIVTQAYANPPPGWRSYPDSQDLIYEPLDLRFPARIGDLVRVNPTTYDSQGLDVSIGYNSTKVHLVITLYIYLRSYYEHSDIESHFQYCIKEIQRKRPNSVVISQESTIFPIGGAEVIGLKAFVRYNGGLPSGEWGSYAVLLPYGERFVLLRASFLRGDLEKVVESVWIIVKDLMWTLRFPIEYISQTSREYTPISEWEKREYENSDREVFPDDVRESVDNYRTTTVAWTGVIEDVRIDEKEQFSEVSFLCRHFYYDWIEYFGPQTEHIFLSSKGEGQFSVSWRVKKGTPSTSFDDVGDLLIAFGKPIRIENDVIYLDTTYIRGIDQTYFKHSDAVYEFNKRTKTHD
jgi:hypothetical protein